MRESRWTGVVVLLLLALLWEAAGRGAWVHKVLLPPLSAVLATLYDIVASGEVVRQLAVSLWRAAAGYALAAALGIALGIAMGYWRRVYQAAEITVELVRAVPQLRRAQQATELVDPLVLRSRDEPILIVLNDVSIHTNRRADCRNPECHKL